MLLPFSITAHPNGTGQLVVDGKDISRQVTGVAFQTRGYGHPPLLQLTLLGEGTIEGLGEVQLVRSQDGPDGEMIASFLSSLDAHQLEKDVLEGMGLLEGDGESNFTTALLKRLATIARGEW